MSGSKASRKLLFLCPKGSYDSGGVISNFQLIKYLNAKGYQVKVITSWRADYNDVLKAQGIEYRTVPYNWWLPRDLPEDIASRCMHAVKSIVNEITSYEPDVVVTNTSHIPWGALAASITDVPHIWIVREFPINNFEYLKDKVPFIHAYSNKMMANSRELSEYYRREYDYDVGAFMSYVSVENIQLGKKSTHVNLVSPNYISETKNQIDLIKAASILRKRRKDLVFRVVLMGEKDKIYWPMLQQAINDHGVADIVEVFDRVEKPWEKVSLNDIVVQTSLSESIGRTTTEAMKLGVPVIASDIPGHREAFALGGGTHYELGNANDLAEKIAYLIDHPKDRYEKAEAVKRKVIKSMSDEACNGQFAAAIEEVSGKPNPVGANKTIWPYLEHFIKDHAKQQQTIALKNRDTDMLYGALEEVRNSRAYKVGSVQGKILRNIIDIVKLRRHS